MMEENNRDNSGRKNTILLTVIGVSTLLVALVGATFAYFTAQLSGNPTNDNVNITTDTYGLTVFYEDGKDSISLENQNLTVRDASDIDPTTYPQDEINFRVISTSNQDQFINIGLAEGFTNSFCRTVETQEANECSDLGPIDVSDELYYELYTCDSDYTTNCQSVKTSVLPTPVDETTPAVLGGGITVPGSGDKTVYLVFKAFIKNKEVPQNYNQGKAFSGKLWVSEDLD